MVLNSKIYGSGEPIIILHGLLGSLDNWQTVSKYFGQQYQVITLDARNHGRSEHIPEFNYEEMMQDVLDTMESMQLNNATIVGHSMGGKTAMYLALNHPEKVKQLAIIDIAPITYQPHHDDVFAAIKAVPLDKIEQRADAENIIKNYIDEYDVVQFIMKGLYRKEDNSFAWRYNIEDIYPAYDHILEFNISNLQYPHKTIFIKGANSKYIQDKDMSSIYSFFPNAQIASIEGAGHWVHAEKPKEFIFTLEAFFK